MKHVLISPDQLLDLRQNGRLVLIDTRPAEEYEKGHILDAINMPEFFTYLATEESGGLEEMGRFFVEALSRNGVSNHNTVVFYENSLTTGYGQSCRGYFILSYFGHDQVFVLNGGLAAWLARGWALTAAAVAPAPSVYVPRFNKQLVASKSDVLQALGDKNTVILDCRDREEWIGVSSSPYGRDFCPRKGRIPGAVWLEWYRVMAREAGYPVFRSKEACQEEFRRVGIDANSRVIIYCFKGSRASNTMIALHDAGVTHVRNYFASWNEWSRDQACPIDSRQLSDDDAPRS